MKNVKIKKIYLIKKQVVLLIDVLWVIETNFKQTKYAIEIPASLTLDNF